LPELFLLTSSIVVVIVQSGSYITEIIPILREDVVSETDEVDILSNTCENTPILYRW